jgi:MFS family permease
VLLAGFAVNEARHTHAVFPLRLLASRNRAFAYTLAGLVPATLFGTFFFLTEYFQDVLRYSPLRAGIAFLPMTLAMFATVRTLPRVLPRTGVRPVIVVGATLALAATAVLTRIDAGTAYLTGVLPALLLIGLGAGMCFMPLNVAVLTGVPGRDSGAATGMLQTLQWGGGSVGLAVLVTASDTAAGDPLAGLTRAFVAAGAFAVVAVGVATFGLTRPRTGVADEPARLPPGPRDAVAVRLARHAPYGAGTRDAKRSRSTTTR